ncbi:hypothetical protein JCGZ_22241 [Jatropha curcas]|uniref:Uncharacterized protein n=1 Tax=Jatropha curcas TaxID=180498 RepID=A0A067K1L5_JATCU|nr:hypothetical protein JCGZ_22241 [Jatropha curcas]
MERILNPALAPRSKSQQTNTPKSRALPEDARATHTQKKQVASATSTYAGATSRFKSQKQLEQKSRASLSSARARESLLRGRRFASESRERDLYKRERESRFPGDVFAAFSSEKHIFSCKGRDSSQEKSPQAPLSQPITTKTTITLLLYK